MYSIPVAWTCAAFPATWPELNPDEFVWTQAKRELANIDHDGLVTLTLHVSCDPLSASADPKLCFARASTRPISRNTTPSPQQRQHWLSEQALAWSGLPVVTIRPKCRSDGARPLRLPRLMSLGWSPPSSSTLARTWAGCTSSPVRGRKTCTVSPGNTLMC